MCIRDRARAVFEGFVRVREDGFAGNFGPNFQTAGVSTVGGLAGISPGLQDELDKLVQKLKRKDLRRKRRKILADQDYVSRIVDAVLAVRATKIVGGQ